MRIPNHKNQVERLTLGLVIFLSISMLSACGFKLRENSIFAQTLPNLDIECKGDSWRLCQRLRNQLQIQGMELSKDSPFLLKVSTVDSNTRALTITGDASVAEYELEHRARYELIAKSSDFVLQEQTVRSSRLYDHNNKALLSQERQIDELEISLQKALADKILNQLSLIDITTIQLAEQEEE